MDYDLSRLSTRSFEQLVQGLAVRVFGPGIVVFGDGPDGGREATFDGRVPFPSPEEPWAGYGVVQAKFRQRPRGGGGDLGWALDQLGKDLKKLRDPRRGLRQPDYYLFATNVVLTPTEKTGGKDRVADLLGQQGFKDYRVWDHDQICTLLDTQSDVRTAYAAWVTAGDVLAAVLDRLPAPRPDLRTVMRSFIQKELRNDQYVNLGQAGHLESDRTPLARVFVDLPVSERPGEQRPAKPSSAPGDEAPADDATEDSTPSPGTGILSELHSISAQRLDPGSNPKRQVEPDRKTDENEPGRLVVIGGPGQGKSTLGQFLCQIHRVALLGLEPERRPPPEVAAVCELIRAQCAAEGLALPAVPRFPLRVELSRFARALADGSATSLFGWLRVRIAAVAEREILADDLHAWLGVYPWLLVLDGLDEVPASSNRTQVLDSIQAFLIDAQNAEADLLLVATSRPQGYNDDFSPRWYRHRWLMPLDVPHALSYAGRLATERWGGDPARVERVLTRLRRAGDEPATARLMQSPLQVAIMTLLVDTAGEPPRERWRLFAEYHRVIYDRERQRDIPAARLLNDYQAEIDSIHQRVGLCLQTRSERVGGTDATLSDAEFAALVDARLTEEGHDEADRSALTKAIVEAALHRLVFLVAPRDAEIGFEIRSLQEFMAAQWLTTGADQAVRERLAAIAPAAHWRNVFLFAAGRCFHRLQHLRDSIYTLCCELNDGGQVEGGGALERATLAGSRLALEILEDGAVARQPAQVKLYARLALRLMELPPCPEHLRLAEQCRPGLEGVYREEIERRLDDTLIERRLGAWRVLLCLVGTANDWAGRLAATNWPQEPEAALDIFQSAEGLSQSKWLAQQWADRVPFLPPAEVRRIRDRQTDFEYLKATPAWAASLLDRSEPDRDSLLEIQFDKIPKAFVARARSVRNSNPKSISVPPIAGFEWQWLSAIEEFRETPSRKGLSQLIEAFERNIALSNPSLFRLPWPLAACLQQRSNGADLTNLAQSVIDGLLGNAHDWEKAERRWIAHGVTAKDLSHERSACQPFDQCIGDSGFPADVCGWRMTHDDTLIDVATGLAKMHQAAASQYSGWLANCILTATRAIGVQGGVLDDSVVSELHSVIADTKWSWGKLDILSALPNAYWKDESAVAMLASLGDLKGPGHLLGVGGAKEQMASQLEELARKNPKCGGLLRLLAEFCSDGWHPDASRLHFLPDSFADPRHRTAAILIRLASGDWTEADVENFVTRLMDQADPDDKVVRSTLRILSHLEGLDRPKERLLTAFYAALPTAAWEDRKAVMADIHALQRRRLSAPISGAPTCGPAIAPSPLGV